MSTASEINFERATRPVENTVYGMREFEITDPDGNVVCFGEDMDRLAGS